MKSNDNQGVLFPFSTPTGDLNTPETGILGKPQGNFNDYACDPNASLDTGKTARVDFSFR